MQEAQFYIELKNGNVRCELCPWYCELKPGQTGICKVRKNENGKLITQVYNRVAAMGTDPIEKKPLYHFYPGKNILSVGEPGCNLHCTFCQNYNLSQSAAEKYSGFKNITSTKIKETALYTPNNIGVAYTYNEPLTFYEFVFDTAKLVQKAGLKNVVVSNGYINPEPLKKLLPVIDAFNIDLKAFSNEFYKKQTTGKLQPILDSLKIIAKSGSHLEITNLIIPTLNDNENEFRTMVKWIATELGTEIPLHLSRYFPQYKMQLPPTPTRKLETLYSIAKEHLQYVYLGNISNKKHSSTFCPNCGELLIERNGYQTKIKNLDIKGNCKKCNSGCNIIL